MALPTDLHTLLTEYALKIKNAYVDKKAFFNNLMLTARLKTSKSEAWRAWTVRPKEKFRSELESLINNNSIESGQNGDGEFIYVPAFYVERIRQIWAGVGENLNDSFPGESALGDAFPDDLIKTVDYEKEFLQLLKENPVNDLPAIRLIFPDRCLPIITLPSIISSRLLDEAIRKISFFMADPENKNFFINRLQHIYSNYMAYIDELMNNLISDTNSFKYHVQSGESNDFYLISGLCGNIREFIDSDKESSDKTAGVLQSIYLLETYNLYYREKSSADSETVKCKSIIETRLDEAPYFYTTRMIMDFFDETGKCILEYLPREKIVDIVKKKTAVTPSSRYLPELLFFFDDGKEPNFVLKNKLYPGFEFQMNLSRPGIYKNISKRWLDLIRNYRSESAMKNDVAFENLLLTICDAEASLFKAVYCDSKFNVVRHELAADDEVASAASQYFVDDVLLPLYKILFLDRRTIISSINSTLPFWFSIPFLVAIIRFFKGIK
jgi:hypothetical protein